MEERRDYAVLRFVDQNGWSYMVNDYAKGCSLMEYIKQGIRVEKETVFDWIRQLSKQLEQYYRCGNEDAAYGYVNPWNLQQKNVWIQRHLHGKKSESGKECLESVIAVGKMP